MSALNSSQFQMREIKTGLEDKPTKTLVHGVRALKAGMDKAAALPAAVRVAPMDKGPNDTGRASPALSMALSAALLSTHERELRKRGISPSHPSLGVDWSALINEVKNER